MVCDKPHIIIWAQRGNAKHWPAKVMAFNEDCVIVRFFGGNHKLEYVSENKCFLFSKNVPSNNAIRVNDYSEYKSALKVK